VFESDGVCFTDITTFLGPPAAMSPAPPRRTP